MNDLIERQTAIDEVNAYLGLSAVSRTVQNMTSIQEILEKLPSAQPEIIRCRDCVKREICRTTTIWAVAPSDDWFCADGERREDG